jgi:hypothetical protein
MVYLGPGTSAKRIRIVPKRINLKGGQDDSEHSDKQDEKGAEEIDREKQVDQHERILISPRKVIQAKVLHSQAQPAMNKEQLALIEVRLNFILCLFFKF